MAAVTVAMLQRTGYAGPTKNGQSVDEVLLNTFLSNLGPPRPLQEIRRSSHFHSAACAGSSMLINNVAFVGDAGFEATTRCPRPQQVEHQSNDAPWGACEDWQIQRRYLDSTIESLLQKLVPPDSASTFPALMSHYCSPPPGRGSPLQAGLLQSDVIGALKSCYTSPTTPPGLEHERQAVEVGKDAHEAVENRPFVENIPLPAMAVKGAEKSMNLEAQADPEDALDKGRKRTLLIAYYPRGTTEESLRSVFQKFGQVHIVNLVKDRSGSNACYGFIRFATGSPAEQAYLACQTGRVVMHDSDGKAWYLKASWAKNAFGKKGKTGKHPKVWTDK